MGLRFLDLVSHWLAIGVISSTPLGQIRFIARSFFFHSSVSSPRRMVRFTILFFSVLESGPRQDNLKPCLPAHYFILFASALHGWFLLHFLRPEENGPRLLSSS